MIILLIIYAIIILAAYFGVFVCFFALIKIIIDAFRGKEISSSGLPKEIRKGLRGW